jgi:acetyl-CoA acetyltransferase
LAEDPTIRLTTNIINVEPDHVYVGMAVRVVFCPQGEAWIPLFEPEPAADRSGELLAISAPQPLRQTPVIGQKFEDKVAITGIGASQIGRRLLQSELSLTIDACLSAVEDAGLTLAEIDGLCGYPGSEGLPGMSKGGVRAVEQILRINPAWHCGAHEVPGQIGTVIDAMMAVASGLCRHVLCFTSFSEKKRPSPVHGDSSVKVRGEPIWALPFGCASPANWLALYASQYCAKYAVDADFLGTIAISARTHAARNPNALYRDPIDMAAYRAARMISSPFRLLDCDVPCDGAMAIIISAREAAQDGPHRPVLVEAVGTRIGEPQSWDQGTVTHQPQVFSAAAHLWSRTDLGPKDVDVAMLYDGFTFNAVSWIEALGFCGLGEAAGFLDGGRQIALDGGLPMNTHGGHLSAGRTNGYGHLLEAVAQMRGQAEGRQVADARVAVVTTGGAIPAGCLLLRRD